MKQKFYWLSNVLFSRVAETDRKPLRPSPTGSNQSKPTIKFCRHSPQKHVYVPIDLDFESSPELRLYICISVTLASLPCFMKWSNMSRDNKKQQVLILKQELTGPNLRDQTRPLRSLGVIVNTNHQQQQQQQHRHRTSDFPLLSLSLCTSLFLSLRHNLRTSTSTSLHFISYTPSSYQPHDRHSSHCRLHTNHHYHHYHHHHLYTPHKTRPFGSSARSVAHRTGSGSCWRRGRSGQR